MNRREALALLAAAIAAPRRARAASAPDQPLVGILWPSSVEADADFAAAIRKGLSDAGYVEGRNVVLAMRYANGAAERVAPLAAELAALKPRVLMAPTDTVGQAIRAAAPDVPLVIMLSSDPVSSGLAESYARPGGMVTGVTLSGDPDAILGKRLNVLHELVPDAKRVALIFNPDAREELAAASSYPTAAARLGIEGITLAVRDADALDEAFAEGGRQQADAFSIGGSFFRNSAKIAALALRARKPTLGIAREYAAAGLLASYGASLIDLYRRLPAYVAKILAGAKPGDLPIELPTIYHLAINLRTAKALGVAIPPTLLARADEVFE
jgi:putative ABC transport system substrate-binding protein